MFIHELEHCQFKLSLMFLNERATNNIQGKQSYHCHELFRISDKD